MSATLTPQFAATTLRRGNSNQAEVVPMSKSICTLFIALCMSAMLACGQGGPNVGESGEASSETSLENTFVEMTGLDGEPVLLAVSDDSVWSVDGPGHVRLEALGRQFTLTKTHEGDHIVVELEGSAGPLGSAQFGADPLSTDDEQRLLFAADGELANADPLGLVDPMALVLLLPENWTRLDAVLAGAEEIGASTEALRLAPMRPAGGGLVLGVSSVCVGACSGACAAACIGACFWNPWSSSCSQCSTKCMDHCTANC